MPVVYLKNKKEFCISTERPRIGNYQNHANVVSEHSRDATQNKITITININSHFFAFPIIKRREMFHGNKQISDWPWYIYEIKDDTNPIGLQGFQYI